jgi:hypothetical protein
MKSAILLLSTLIAFAVGVTTSSEAQEASKQASMIPVLLVVPELASSHHDDITLTRRTGEGYVAVLPRRAVTAANFDALMGNVYRLLDRDGDAARDDSVFHVAVRPAAVNGRPTPLPLARLLRSSTRNLRGMQSVHVLTIYVPGKAARAAHHSTTRSN